MLKQLETDLTQSFVTCQGNLPLPHLLFRSCIRCLFWLGLTTLGRFQNATLEVRKNERRTGTICLGSCFTTTACSIKWGTSIIGHGIPKHTTVQLESQGPVRHPNTTVDSLQRFHCLFHIFTPPFNIHETQSCHTSHAFCGALVSFSAASAGHHRVAVSAWICTESRTAVDGLSSCFTTAYSNVKRLVDVTCSTF